MRAKIRAITMAVLGAIGIATTSGVAAQGRSIPLERPVVSAESASEKLHSLTAMMAAMHRHYLGVARKANPSIFDEPKRKTPEAQRAFESETAYFMAAHNAALTLGYLAGSITRYEKHNGMVSRFLVNQDDLKDSRAVFHDPRRIAACNAEIVRAAEAFEQAHARQLRDAPRSEMTFNFAPLYETITAAAERARRNPSRLAFEPTQADKMTLETAAGKSQMGWQQDHTIIRYTLSKPVRLLHLYGSYAVTHGVPEYSTLYKDDSRDLVEYLAASCISPKMAMEYREKSQQELRVMHQEIARVFKP